MNKSVLSSVLVIAVVALMVGGATLAYFNDTETSSGNTFTAGTLDLKVGDWDEWPVRDGVTATWVMPHMIPGVTTVGPLTVNLQNAGTVAADHVEISFSHSIDEATNPVESDTNPASTPGEMARWIEITSMTYNGTNWLNSLDPKVLVDANGNGWIDLEDVTLPPNTNVGGPLDDLPPPLSNSGGIRNFTMALAFRAGATNDIQGDILTIIVTFTLNQDASQ